MSEGSKESISALSMFQILVLSNLCGVNGSSGTGAKKIDKSSFDKVLGDLSPRVALRVEDHLTGGKAHLHVDLTFGSLGDFHPTAILERVDVLRECLGLCRVLTSVAKGEEGKDEMLKAVRGSGAPDSLKVEVESWIGGTTGTGPSDKPPPNVSGDILSAVGMPEEGAGGSKDHVGALIEQLGIPRKEVAGVPVRSAAAAALGVLCGRVGAQLDAILHHRDFQALESAWRGLHLLVTRTDFQGPPVAIHVVTCERASLLATLRSSLEQPASSQETNGIDAVLIDYDFDQSAGDLADLRGIAEAGEQWYCPIIVSGSSALLGIEEDGSYSDLPSSIRARFDDPELIEWRTFRKERAANYLAVTLPHTAGRLLYGPKTIPVAEIAYQESATVLRIGGIWALGAVMMHSVASSGWCTAFSGMQDGTLDSMPIGPLANDHAQAHSATEVVWTDTQLTELARAGFVVLSGRRNQNRVSIMAVPTLFEAEPVSDVALKRETTLQATLPYRLFATRVTRRLERALAKIDAGMSNEDVENLFLLDLGALFGRPDCVRARVQDAEDDAGVRNAMIQVLPQFTILGGNVDLLLEFTIAR